MNNQKIIDGLKRIKYLLALEADNNGKVRREHIKAELQLSPELEECREITRALLTTLNA